MIITWSDVQTRRLKELDADVNDMSAEFNTLSERDRVFQELERKLVKQSKQRLETFRRTHLRPALCRLESTLVDTLTQSGFVQVVTPIIMSKGLLAKMSIDKSHPLFSQVFWLDEGRCLRPMLAPHLYYILKDLLRVWQRPVRIFEVGTCFRKESQGAQHSSEFTMLNLVEMGLPEQERDKRLEDLATLVSRAAGIHNFNLKKETSVVYGETTDVIAGKEEIEVGSGAMGPHPLDRAWRITENWVGIGFGLERLLMVRDNSTNLGRVGRSLSYLNGIRLNL
jgi:phenylalanyl-tRNA synthetase alpha chain